MDDYKTYYASINSDTPSDTPSGKRYNTFNYTLRDKS